MQIKHNLSACLSGRFQRNFYHSEHKTQGITWLLFRFTHWNSCTAVRTRKQTCSKCVGHTLKMQDSIFSHPSWKKKIIKTTSCTFLDMDQMLPKTNSDTYMCSENHTFWSQVKYYYVFLVPHCTTIE